MSKRFLSISMYGLVALAALTLPGFASEDRETPVVRAIKRAKPSVVNIHTEKPASERDAVFTTGKARKVNGMGTGMIIDERGYIVTNHHVIAEVDTIRVRLPDGGDYDGRVIATDREHDLAVIKIDATKPLRVIPTGTSSDLMLGETVLAIGNAFGYHDTVTLGIVSALGRDVEVNETQSYRNLIQTDASINPGNSGGPLINLDGEVIGINVAIRAGAQRIGFAIPIDDARKLIATLISIERLESHSHGLLGRDIKEGTNRMLVVDAITPDSPGAAAGLKPGDIVLKVGSLDVIDAVDLERALIGKQPGETFDLLVRRNDKTEKLAMSIAPTSTARVTMNRIDLTTTTRANNDDPLTDRVWTTLGLRMAPLPATQRHLVAPKYRGGMQVIEVKAGSPAANNGIQSGDILVGLHQWETVSSDNISWILNQPLPAHSSLKFYLIRGSETLFGHLQLTSK